MTSERMHITQRALAVVHEVVRAVLVPREPIELCRAIFHALPAVVPFDAGYVDLYNQQADVLQTLYRIDEGLEEIHMAPWNHWSSVTTSWILRQRQPLVFADLHPDMHKRFPDAKTRTFGQAEKPSRAWMSVPLILEQRVIGIINVQSYQTDLYGPFEQYLLQVLANPLAVALENSHLINALEHAVQRLKIPIIPLTREVLVVPLLGVLDQPGWEDLTERILTTIGAQAAGGILLDASGISSFDPHTIRAITTLIRAIDLLGAQSVVIGMRPELIQGMVQAGSDFTRISTARDLTSGLTSIQRRL